MLFTFVSKDFLREKLVSYERKMSELLQFANFFLYYK